MLRRRIQWGMHLGLVRPGDRLPSLRAAAAEFDVDQRSVLAAYRELERDGIVDMRPRSGIYVAVDPHTAPQLPGAARWMSELFLQGYSRGITPVSLGHTLTSAISAASLTAACVECNADQILWMARHLREEFGLSTTWIELGALGPEAIAERLHASDFIVTTTFHAAEARRLGAEHGLPVIVVTAGRDEAGVLRAELGRGPGSFVGADERYARKLVEAADSGRWMTNLRAIVIEQLKSTELPPDAPLVFTAAAADILGSDLPDGATVIDYGFSNESRTEIIAHMLNAVLKAKEVTVTSSPDPAVR
jgi:hypothetical protein